jgi:hypothetical protein
MMPTKIGEPSSSACATERSIGNVAPLRPAPEHFAANADDLSFAGFQVIAEIPVVTALIRLWHQHLYIAADDFKRCVAKEAFARRIEHQDHALRVDQNDAVNRAIDHRA